MRQTDNSESSPNIFLWLWVPDLRWRLSGTTAQFSATLCNYRPHYTVASIISIGVTVTSPPATFRVISV